MKRTLRKFNPGTFQSDQEVTAQFVVRQHELAWVLEVLRENIDAQSCQHLLLLAERGQGKTMLLARVAAELRANTEYSGKLLPVRFMEESHEVFDITDFWLDALYYLAKECASQVPDLAHELEGAHRSLAGEWRDPLLHYRAQAMVLDAADRLGKQLVLMVENLQALCPQAGQDFGWKLRESLQMEPSVILLGTATTRFRALDDAREAFFEGFFEITLKPLDTEECGRLWHATTGNKVRWHQVRPVEILTGGSPRLLVIVADFVRQRSRRLLLDELVALIDDHTEYFRGHLEALPKTERRVYLATISLWRPSSTSEIAARARMGIRITSSMLGRLVDRGVLRAEGRPRKKRYAATERLYSIYYKLRRERDKAADVQNLIRFMALYYGSPRAEMEEGCRAGDLLARTRILHETGDVDAARRSLQALCATTDPTSDEAVVAMHDQVVALAASGLVSSDELADPLAADRQMAATFRPLLVALRQLAGQPARAPIEVTEVARDIREEIEDLKAARARRLLPSRRKPNVACMNKPSSRRDGGLAQPELAQPAPRIAIRPVEDMDGLRACVELQRGTWGRTFSEVVPASMLQITAKMGGVALGAFDGAGELVGFVYGITGFRHGAPAHWSHMLAVRPEARNMGVGRRLKLRQKEMLLTAGVSTMYWTFDPLVSRNAHLNLNRLGARVAEYVPEMYGVSDSDLHDLGTDRFVVEWKLDEERGPAERREATGTSSAVKIAASAEQADAGDTSNTVEVPIPADIEAVKARSPEEAMAWRMSTRQAFTRLLAEGRTVSAFVPGAEQSTYVVAPKESS